METTNDGKGIAIGQDHGAAADHRQPLGRMLVPVGEPEARQQPKKKRRRTGTGSEQAVARRRLIVHIVILVVLLALIVVGLANFFSDGDRQGIPLPKQERTE